VAMLRMAVRCNCRQVDICPLPEFSDLPNSRYSFKAIVYKSPTCRGFVGYGHADLSNVSPLVHVAEMRGAETRVVNRALRKAYGIGICSVEELGCVAEPTQTLRETKKPQPANGNHGVRPQATGRDSVFSDHHHGRTTPRIRPNR
jgi:hypothetical protein